MNLPEFEKEISSFVLQPIQQLQAHEIDLSIDDIRYIPPRERIEKEISDNLCPKYQPFVKEDPKDWLQQRKKLFDQQGVLKYSAIKEEIDKCELKSVGKNKYPFDFFTKANIKEVNYVKWKKPRIEENPEKKQDLVISIAIYSNEKKGRAKSHSFLVLGSQTLDTLADAIYCYNNFTADKDVNERNSYFFIENCFYNKEMVSDEKREELSREDQQLQTDLFEFKKKIDAEGPPSEKMLSLIKQKTDRHLQILKILIRYQEPITWLRSKNRNVTYHAVPMETTHFGDLSLKIGVQYLYCHNGCEHLFVVENVRSYSSQCDNYDTFPVLLYQNKVRRLKCFVCNYLPGRVVTADDASTCENPCLFCDVCFACLHPDDDTLLPEEKSYEKHPYFLDS